MIILVIIQYWLQRVNKGCKMDKNEDKFDWERFNRQSAGDEREYTPEEEKQIKKEALKEVELLKQKSAKKDEGSK